MDFACMLTVIAVLITIVKNVADEDASQQQKFPHVHNIATNFCQRCHDGVRSDCTGGDSLMYWTIC
jgi:hypothetical protein